MSTGELDKVVVHSFEEKDDCSKCVEEMASRGGIDDAVRHLH